jgi:transposase
MANVLSEEKKQQVLALGRLGWPLRRIEHATGVRRETASGYLRAAGVPIRPPRGWGHAKPAKDPITDPSAVVDGVEASKPAKEVITDSPVWPTASRSPAASACEPYRELIEQGLAVRRNAMAIWQELVDRHGFSGGYASVMRFVRKLRGSSSPEAHPVIESAPGEESQVDYGEGPMVRDGVTGKYRRTRLFVMTLGCSRKSVRLLTWRSSARIWCELHEKAFRRLGGATRTVVLDNLKEGVLTPDVYDAALNPLYRDVLAHYGVVALPCRVRHPDRKGKVESGIGHTQRTALKGLRFESLELAQRHLDDWDTRWADTRIHGTTKRQVAAMFAEERSHLLALPLEPFRYYQYGKRTVHLDGHVEVDGAYYSSPPGNIGRELSVQWDGHRVRLLDVRTGELLREHRAQERGRHRTHDADKPAKTPSSTASVLSRARVAGQHTGALAAQIHHREGEPGVRRILGLLGLAKKHGPIALDEACALALSVGAPSYRFVRRYLDARPQPPLSLRQVDPLIRDLTHYRDVIARMTKETT